MDELMKRRSEKCEVKERERERKERRSEEEKKRRGEREKNPEAGESNTSTPLLRTEQKYHRNKYRIIRLEINNELDRFIPPVSN